ncbi:MAG: DUF4038 domain-containing protein [Chthonomonadales bacterium]|nr:DUF4038 domain-containing protein [Chthonomonadales bacterium]
MESPARPWQHVEIELRSERDYANPYTDVEVWAVFRHDSGHELVRPAFWDGGSTWRIRFASPLPGGRWTWRSYSSPNDASLAGRSGSVEIVTPTDTPANRFYRHGFWSLPTGCRNLRHADGTPALMAADTPWALPWRATTEQCEIYAADRQSKGFNAALLMSVQPDMDARGPRSRTEQDGFDVGFEDLPDGHLNALNPAYFRYVDRLAAILIEHEIVPVWQPVFHGYGWKGLRTAGPVVPAHEYARYCRYLVARYGAQPALWLVSADGDGLAPGVDAGGWEIERWDAYRHPTGIHYGPNRHPWAHQDKPWLDFQWCQTGHNGEHVPQRVTMMWAVRPVRAVANGEPTYEHIGARGRAAGWWQGHEAWLNLTSGGTMGVVYGAASLWQWRLDPDEPHEAWCCAEGAGWRDALDFEGSRYVGMIPRLFEGLPFAEMEPDYWHTYGRAALAVPGKLLLVYLPDGGHLDLVRTDDVPPTYRVVDLRTGETVGAGDGHGPAAAPVGVPCAVIFGRRA